MRYEQKKTPTGLDDHRFIFRNTTDWFRLAEGEPVPGSYMDVTGRSNCSSQRIDNKHNPWSGTPTFGDAVTLRKKGWTEGLKAAEKLSTKVEAVVGGMMPIQEVRYDVTGQWIDMGRFTEGDPECFGYLDDGDDALRSKGKIVRIGVNFAISAGIDSATIMRRGVAITAIARMLELVGRSVQIDVVWSTNGNRNNRLVMVIPVKNAGESLSPELMAYCVGHSSMLRRHCFAAMEQIENNLARSLDIGGGYGMPTSLENEYDVYFPQVSYSDFQSEKAVIENVIATLKGQGVEVEA